LDLSWTENVSSMKQGSMNNQPCQPWREREREFTYFFCMVIFTHVVPDFYRLED
jgi:hypothetical protein